MSPGYNDSKMVSASSAFDDISCPEGKTRRTQLKRQQIFNRFNAEEKQSQLHLKRLDRMRKSVVGSLEKEEEALRSSLERLNEKKRITQNPKIEITVESGSSDESDDSLPNVTFVTSFVTRIGSPSPTHATTLMCETRRLSRSQSPLPRPLSPWLNLASPQGSPPEISSMPNSPQLRRNSRCLENSLSPNAAQRGTSAKFDRKTRSPSPQPAVRRVQSTTDAKSLQVPTGVHLPPINGVVSPPRSLSTPDMRKLVRNGSEPDVQPSLMHLLPRRSLTPRKPTTNNFDLKTSSLPSPVLQQIQKEKENMARVQRKIAEFFNESEENVPFRARSNTISCVPLQLNKYSE